MIDNSTRKKLKKGKFTKGISSYFWFIYSMQSKTRCAIILFLQREILLTLLFRIESLCNIGKTLAMTSKAPERIIGGKTQIATSTPLYISWSKIYNLSLNMNTNAWLMIGNIPTKLNTKEAPRANRLLQTVFESWVGRGIYEGNEEFNKEKLRG